MLVRSVLQMCQHSQREERSSLVGAAALTLPPVHSPGAHSSPPPPQLYIPVATDSQARTDSTSEILPGFSLGIPELRTWFSDGLVLSFWLRAALWGF